MRTTREGSSAARPISKVARKPNVIGNLRVGPDQGGESVAHRGEGRVVGEVLQLARVGLVVVELRPLLAAVPLGVAVALGADAAAHEPRCPCRRLAGRGRRAAAHLREGRPVPRRGSGRRAAA